MILKIRKKKQNRSIIMKQITIRRIRKMKNTGNMECIYRMTEELFLREQEEQKGIL